MLLFENPTFLTQTSYTIPRDVSDVALQMKTTKSTWSYTTGKTGVPASTRTDIIIKMEWRNLELQFDHLLDNKEIRNEQWRTSTLPDNSSFVKFKIN